jgi:hypothetical protein
MQFSRISCCLVVNFVLSEIEWKLVAFITRMLAHLEVSKIVLFVEGSETVHYLGFRRRHFSYIDLSSNQS